MFFHAASELRDGFQQVSETSRPHHPRVLDLVVDMTLLVPKHRSFRQIELARYRLRRAVRNKQKPRRVVHAGRVRIFGFRITTDDVVHKVSRVRQPASEASGFAGLRS